MLLLQVLHTTAVKQREISAFLENLRESRCQVSHVANILVYSESVLNMP